MESPAAAEVLPLGRSWTWFAHTDADTVYDESCVDMGSFDSVNDFFRYCEHVPTPDRIFGGTHALRLPAVAGGCHVTGYAIFETGVRPMWEDARNANGCDVCARGSFDAETLKALWAHVTLDMVNEAIGEGVLGVRLTHRAERRTGAIVHKLEVWLARSRPPDAVVAYVRALVPVGASVDVVSHASTSTHTPRGRPYRRRG